MDKNRVEVPWFLERGVSESQCCFVGLFVKTNRRKFTLTFSFRFSVDRSHEYPRILDNLRRVSLK